MTDEDDGRGMGDEGDEGDEGGKGRGRVQEDPNGVCSVVPSAGECINKLA